MPRNADPTGALPPAETLERLKFQAARVFDDTGMSGLTTTTRHRYLNDMTGRLAFELRAELYGKQHPPQQITAPVTVPRFASPWQHFKARYRDRWWMWALRDLGFMRSIRYVDEPVPVTVEVAPKVLYPHARAMAPPDIFGAPVLYFTNDQPYSPW